MGTLDEESQRMENLLAEHKEEKRTSRQQLEQEEEREREVIRRVLEQEDGDEEMEKIVLPADAEAKREQWDAETILTTYSTLNNHPKLISEPKKNWDPFSCLQRLGSPRIPSAEASLLLP